MRTARTTMIIALSVAAFALPTAAGACDDVEVTVTWAMPTPAGGWAQPPTAQTATWPQTLATGDECGGWSQVDVYLGLQSDINKILADKQLTQGEDSLVVAKGSWSFVKQQPCPTPTPTPEPVPIPTPTPTPTPTLEPVPIPTPTPTPTPTLEPVQKIEVLSGGDVVLTPPAIVLAGAAVPVAASPRFTG